MADPLSITTGVVGALTAATQISSLLVRFTKSTRNAPTQARHVLTEINEASANLSLLHSLLVQNDFVVRSQTWQENPVPRERASLLMVEHVVTIVSGCVMTFSELERLLDELKTRDMRILDRVKWARRETDIIPFIQRLQNHKGSLSLMLNVLNGSTIHEAKSSLNQIHSLIVRQYQSMSSRLQVLESQELRRMNSTLTNPAHTGAMLTSSPQTALDRENELDLSMTRAATDTNAASDYLDELKRSRVYRKESTWRMSTISKDDCTTTCSRLSAFSLAEVSNISVINLAITSEDVHNPRRTSQSWSGDHAGRSRPPLRALKPLVKDIDLAKDTEYEYNAIAEKFGDHFFQLQIVVRDVEMYTNDVQVFMQRFLDISHATRMHTYVAQSTYHSNESKWQDLRASMTQMSETALPDHVSAVRKNVIEPIATLLKLYERPQKLVEQRNKLIVDYKRYIAVMNRRHKLDKKIAAPGGDFFAINHTLNRELPRLFSLGGKLVEACLYSFVELQLQWQAVWKRKLAAVVNHHVSNAGIDIVSAYKMDFLSFLESVDPQILPQRRCFAPPGLACSAGGDTSDGADSDPSSTPTVMEYHEPTLGQDDQQYQRATTIPYPVSNPAKLDTIMEESLEIDD